MKALLVYLKPYRLQCVLSPLFKLLEAALELLSPLVVAAIIDRGVAAGDTGYILRMGALLVGLGALGFVMALSAQYFAAKAATGFAASLRGALFARVQRMGYAALDARGETTLVTRLTADVDQVQTGVNMTLRLLLRSPFIVLGAMVMAFTVDARAALVFAALIPLLALAVWLVTRVALPRSARARERLDATLLRVRENLAGVRVLRAFNRQGAEEAAFAGENGALCAAQLRAGRASTAMGPLTGALVNVALIALLYIGAKQVDAGALMRGSVVALVSYLAQILAELVKLANLIQTVTRALACAGRVSEALAPGGEEDAGGGEAPPPAAPGGEAVRFEHVSFRYPGAKADALSDVSFTALRGQRVGVVGGTGSGKTTLVHLIPRFMDATSGTVRVQGRDVRGWPLEALRRRVAIAPQRAALFRGTIRENLLWGAPGRSDAELWKALETAQAADMARARPGGLDGSLEAGGCDLSGGQRQRLALARAVARGGDVLILDDSASALDQLTDAALRKAIRALDPPPATFIVSQRASGVRACDLILVMDEGRLVGAGAHDALMAQCPVYREIYESQYPKEAKPA